MNENVDPVKQELIQGIHTSIDAAIRDIESIDHYTGHFENLNVKSLYDDSIEKIYTLRADINWDEINTNQLHSVLNQIQNFNRHLNRIETNAFEENHDFDFAGQVRSLHKISSSLEVNINNFLRSNLGQKNVDLERKIFEKETELQEKLKELAEREKELKEQELSHTRAESADDASKEASMFFEGNARDFNKSAFIWLRAVCIMSYFCFVSIVFFLVLAVLGLPAIDAENQYQFIRISGTTLFLFTFMFTITYWCMRMYKANLHLNSINKHKAICLEVVGKLRAGSMSNEAKDIITTEAARVIFNDPQTGLINDKSTDHSTSLNIGDLAKTGT